MPKQNGAHASMCVRCTAHIETSQWRARDFVSRATPPLRADVYEAAMSDRPLPRRVQHKCSVHTCYYSILRQEDGDDVTYFKLPKDKDRAKLWLDAIGRESNEPEVMVCEKHFSINFISFAPTRMRLVPTAVPTLNLPQPGDPPYGPAAFTPQDSPPTVPGSASHDELAQVTLDSSDEDGIKPEMFVQEEIVVAQERTYDEAEPGISSLPDPPIKRERLEEDRDAERQAELEKLLELSNAHLEPELARYIEAKVHLQTHKRGEKVDVNLSFFALKLLHSFPQTYKLMQKTLGLPSMVQVSRIFRPLQGEACPRWARLLRARFSGAAAAARACVVMVARAPLRPAGTGLSGGQPARQAAVMVARGLHARWRQPLVCCLLPAEHNGMQLRIWILRVITHLFRIGLDVHALITDFDDRFVPTGPNMPTEKPYFTVANNPRVCCFYDYTQLIVSFRDHFMHYDMNIEDLTATWEVIQEMHEYNRNCENPLPTGLTDDHVTPQATRMAGLSMTRRAKLAEEALARPVASALGIAADMGLLGDVEYGTVRLVGTVADLVDLMHKKLREGTQVFIDEVRSFGDLACRLKNTSLVSKESGQRVNDPGLLAALRATVHGAAALLERVRRSGAGLRMSVINNDPLHEFFHHIRERHGGKKPTSKQMLAAFKRSFAVNAMKSLQSSREEGQLEEFLKAASEMRNVPRSAPVAP